MAVNTRKQTIVILVVCILAVGGVSWYVRGDHRSRYSLGQMKGTQTEIMTTPSGDVLTTNNDWQKDFLATNATGTAFKATSASLVAAKPEQLTATDLLGRAFMTKYAELKRTGLNADSASVKNVMGQVTAQSLASLPSPKNYALSDIRVVVDSKTAAVTYSKDIGATIQTHMPKQNEAEIANQAFNSGDMSQLKAIDANITGYRSMLSALSIMPVPASLANYHLVLMNGVSTALYNSESFRHMDTAPIRGLAAVSLELVALQDIVSSLRGMQNYFNSTGISTSL